MKHLVIYHANCADGFGAAFAAWLKLGDEAEYLPCQYDKVKTDHDFINTFGWLDGREVYILDFSFPREVMDQIFRRANRVVWLDHHKTAFEMWLSDKPDFQDCHLSGHHFESYGQDKIILHNEKSGAVLAWEYFHPGTEVPMLIKHIDDHDRWQFKIEGTKAFNKALWSYAPWSFEQWKRQFYFPDFDTYCHLLTAGEAILRAHGQNVQAMVKGSARKCSIVKIGPADDGDDYELFRVNGLAVNCPRHLSSDVGHELATQSGTYGLAWFIGKEGRVANCSLRSNGDYDVSAIAKAFGGGGHRNAAGFEVDIQTLLSWLF